MQTTSFIVFMSIMLISLSLLMISLGLFVLGLRKDRPTGKADNPRHRKTRQ